MGEHRSLVGCGGQERDVSLLSVHFVFAVGVIVMTQGGFAMRRAVAGSLILKLLAGRTVVDITSVLQRNFCQKILACILNSCKPSCM